MRIITCLLFTLLITAGAYAQKNKNVAAITAVLKAQETAWNSGNLQAFMQGYYVSDSLFFIGKNGVTYGWGNTLNNYKKNYADAALMGQLQFTLLHFKKLNRKNYFVIGKWYLTRSAGNVGGHFSLLFKKIKGSWQIIADHSS